MTYSVVTALDLSLSATGIVVHDQYEAEPYKVQAQTFKPKLKGDLRLSEIARYLQQFTTPADLVVMEDLPMGMRNAAAGSLGLLHGAVRMMLIEDGTPYVLVTPASLKCYATGKGNAKKPDMRMSLYQRAGVDYADDNQVDAAWLWAMGRELMGSPVLDLPQTHRRALIKVRTLNAETLSKLDREVPA